MSHDVFISHSAKDKAIADALCAALEAAGIRCWVAPRDVVPGREWGRSIVEAIEQTKIMVLLFTSNANASPQIRREVERAVNRDVVILPFRTENVVPDKSLEYFIGNVHWLDAVTPPLEAHLGELAKTVKALIEGMDPSWRRKEAQAEAEPLEPGPPENSSAGATARAGIGVLGSRITDQDTVVTSNPISSAAVAPRSNLAAHSTLALLVALNLLTWSHRSSLWSVIGQTAEDLRLSETVLWNQLSTVQLVCYMGAALLFGWLGDRVRRKPLIVFGTIVMSLGTLATAGSENGASFLLCQSAVWVGSAIFDVLALAVLSDFYSERDRTWAFSIFALMGPAGLFVGDLMLNRLASSVGWRTPLVFFAIPGLLFAALYGALGREPERGSRDIIPPNRRRATLPGLFANPAFLLVTLGMGIFDLAGNAIWAWVEQFQTQIDKVQFTAVHHDVTVIVAFSGVIGTAAGGWLAHLMLRATSRALYQVSFWGIALSLPFFAMFLFENGGLAIPLLFAANFFLSLPAAPIIAAAANSISAPVRATALGICLACDQFFSLFLGVNFVRLETEMRGLSYGFASTFIFLAASAIILLIGGRFAPALPDQHAPKAEKA